MERHSLLSSVRTSQTQESNMVNIVVDKKEITNKK